MNDKIKNSRTPKTRGKNNDQEAWAKFDAADRISDQVSRRKAKFPAANSIASKRLRDEALKNLKAEKKNKISGRTMAAAQTFKQTYKKKPR